MDKKSTIINTQFALFFDTPLDRLDLLWTQLEYRFPKPINLGIKWG